MVDAEICRDSVAVWWESDVITSLPRSLVWGRSSWTNQDWMAIDGKFTNTAFANCWRVFWHKATQAPVFLF